MPGLGELTIDLAANITRFDRALTKAERLADKRAKGIKRTFVKMGAAIGLTLGSLGLLKAADNALDFADAIDKAAQRAGISTTKLQELRFAADQMGISTQQLDDAMRRFTRRLGVALEGGSFAKDFAKLGVAINTTTGAARSSGAVFDDVVAAMTRVETQAQRSAFAAQLFGDDAGPQLSLLLKNGTVALDDFAKRARDAGVIMDQDLIKRSVEAKDRISELSLGLSVQFNSALLSLIPTIESVGSEISEFIRNLQEQFGDPKTIPVEALGGRIGTLTDDLIAAKERLTAEKEFEGGGFFEKLFSFEGGLGVEFIENQILEIEEKLAEARTRFDAALGNADETDGAKNFFTGLTQDEMDQQVAAILRNADDIATIDRQLAQERKQAQATVEAFQKNSEASIANNAIALLQVLGSKRKGFALGAIVLQKALAIAQIRIDTAVAQIASLKIDPTGGLAASIGLQSAAAQALVVATGLAQASQLNAAGGGGSAPGTAAQPLITEPAEPGVAPGGTRTTGTLTFNINGVVTDEIMQDLIIPAIQDAVDDKDIILFRNDSRQALELSV